MSKTKKLQSAIQRTLMYIDQVLYMPSIESAVKLKGPKTQLENIYIHAFQESRIHNHCTGFDIATLKEESILIVIREPSSTH